MNTGTLIRVAFDREKNTLPKFILVSNYEGCSSVSALSFEKQKS